MVLELTVAVCVVILGLVLIGYGLTLALKLLEKIFQEAITIRALVILLGNRTQPQAEREKASLLHFNGGDPRNPPHPIRTAIQAAKDDKVARY